MTGAAILAALLVISTVVLLVARHQKKAQTGYGAGSYGDGDAPD